MTKGMATPCWIWQHAGHEWLHMTTLWSDGVIASLGLLEEQRVCLEDILFWLFCVTVSEVPHLPESSPTQHQKHFLMYQFVHMLSLANESTLRIFHNSGTVCMVNAARCSWGQLFTNSTNTYLVSSYNILGTISWKSNSDQKYMFSTLVKNIVLEEDTNNYNFR
jgi:hypothetical protein